MELSCLSAAKKPAGANEYQVCFHGIWFYAQYDFCQMKFVSQLKQLLFSTWLHFSKRCNDKRCIRYQHFTILIESLNKAIIHLWT